MKTLGICLTLAILVGAACGPSRKGTGVASRRMLNVPDPWNLACTDPSSTTPSWLSNGLIGIRIGRDGSGLGANGQPLPFFAIDEYETTGEEKIRVLPNPFAIRLKINGIAVEPQIGAHYVRKLNLSDAALLTAWNQDFGGEEEVSIVSQTRIDPQSRAIAQSWVLSLRDKKASVEIQSGFESAGPENFALAGPEEMDAELGSAPEFAKRVTNYRLGANGIRCRVLERVRGLEGLRENPGESGCTFEGRSSGDWPVSYTRVISYGESPNSLRWSLDGPNSKSIDQSARELAIEPPPPPEFETVRRECSAYWKRTWETDIEIDGPVEDQQAIRSFLFYLRSSIHPEGGMSVSPFGLSNSTYNGHVFWDADVWVFPALALIDPERARAIVEYRLARLGPAKAYAWKTAFPNGIALNGNIFLLRFPWESSVSGRETAIVPTNKQIHVTGGVLKMLDQASRLGILNDRIVRGALGFVPPRPVWELCGGAGTFYRSFARGTMGLKGYVPLPIDGQLELRRVTSTDEVHDVNNDLYTNALAQWVQEAFDPDDPWPFIKRKNVKLQFKLPRDSKTFLTYDGDTLQSYQQASAVLAIYPLQYPPAEKEARVMMERFAGKIAENGPAMSDSIHAVIWARLGEPEKAYETWRKSWQRFTNYPLMMFSEKPKVEQTYFVTGAAGCLQSVLYGFLGFRIDSKKDPGAAWSKPLNGGNFLTVRPHLPKAWKRVTLKNFTVLGKRYTLTATHDSVKVVEE